MDPNANLREQERILTERARTGETRERGRLAELRAGLARWLDREGFAPEWDACPLAAAWFRRTWPGYFQTAPLPVFLVSITRVTYYRVSAADEERAKDAALDGQGAEEGGHTTRVYAEPYDVPAYTPAPADRGETPLAERLAMAARKVAKTYAERAYASPAEQRKADRAEARARNRRTH